MANTPSPEEAKRALDQEVDNVISVLEDGAEIELSGHLRRKLAARLELFAQRSVDHIVLLQEDKLAEAALDAAAFHIQQALKVQTGDLAGHFFSGSHGRDIKNILILYIQAEKRLRAHSAA